jgi:hypothetical protein
MAHALVSIASVGITTILAFVLSVMLLRGSEVWGDIPIAAIWTTSWLLGFAFGSWNLIDAWLDRRAVVRGHRPRRTLTAANWLLRSFAFKTVGCFFMVMAGYSVILNLWGTEARVILLLLGGAAFAANEIANRVDRARLEGLFPIPRRRRAMDEAQLLRLRNVMIYGLVAAINGLATVAAAMLAAGTLPWFEGEGAMAPAKPIFLTALAVLVPALTSWLAANRPRVGSETLAAQVDDKTKLGIAKTDMQVVVPRSPEATEVPEPSSTVGG